MRINELQQGAVRHHYTRQPDAVDGISLVNCCGDFQLAHKSVWYSIRGFEESMIYRAFADTNAMVKAKQLDFVIEKLDYNLYHLNHYNAAYQQMHVVKPLNDKEKYITNFKRTTNLETWGCARRHFDFEMI